MTTVEDLTKTVSSLKESAIALRREFHEHPELAFEETWTADLVAGRMEALGLAVERGIGVTGVLAWLEGTRPGKTLMVRADMDALPMPEPTDRPYHSKIENRNHSCGHDMEMALVVTAAQVLAERRDQIAGRIAFVFQPADEPQTGAKRMIDDGLLDKVKPDVILAQHTMDIPVGKVVAQAGAIWGSVDVLNLTITGHYVDRFAREIKSEYPD